MVLGCRQPKSWPNVSKQTRFQDLGRLGLRMLRIAASTIALVELLRSDWGGGFTAGLAWLVVSQLERRMEAKTID